VKSGKKRQLEQPSEGKSMLDADGLYIIEEAMAKKHIAKYKDLAARLECSERALRGWIKGEHVPRPYYIGKMSSILGIDAHELFLPSRAEKMPQHISRRTFITGMVALPFAMHLSHNIDEALGDTISSHESITLKYRALQRQGVVGIEDGIKGHIGSIQATLENTVSDTNRRELWRILSITQLLARLNVSDRKHLAKAKTWNELAIASAQNSGDDLLLAAMIGHLAHLYMMWPEDATITYQLLDHAHTLAGKQEALQGWLHSVRAAMAAKEGNSKQCEASIDQAMLAIHRIPRNSSDEDAFFTDFNLVGLQAFSANSLLSIDQPKRAYKLLSSIDLQQLARNRHASLYYDSARMMIAMSELETAENYAIKAIDTAVETNRWYIIPRFLSLAQQIEQRDPQNKHARAINEYAQTTLQNQWRS
jgi:hypothetical protein